MADSGATNCPALTTLEGHEGLFFSSQDTAINAVVNVTCADKSSSLVGAGQLTCLSSGQWSDALPTCSKIDKLTDREIVIIAASCAVIFVTLVALIIVVICYYRTRLRNRQKREERLAATLERLSIRDPLDELVRRESRRSSYGNPAFTSSSCDDETDKRLDVPVPGRGGVQLSRQALSTWHYPNPSRVAKTVYGASTLKHRDTNGIRLLKLYKVWDHTRTRKQFVFAENLDELIMKGGEKLNLSGPIRVVLEEDGTEVDNDAVLRACAGMVLLLLEQTQVWSKPEVLLSVHEYSNHLNHYRYDIDEKL